MSLASTLRAKQAQLAEIAVLLADNKPLQEEIDGQIESIGRLLPIVEDREQREAEEAAMKAKLANAEDALAIRVKEAVDHLAKNDDEKKPYKAVLESMSMTNTKALDTFAYLKEKNLTVEQIKLVLGL